MTLPQIYIAAPYPLKDEALLLRRRLLVAGFRVVARWLDEQEENSNRTARLCLDDVDGADIVVAMNPPTWANAGTGGRHVELGYALARNKRIVVIGPRTNVFHHHADIHTVDSVDQAMAIVSEAQ